MKNNVDTSEIVRAVLRDQRMTHKELAEYAGVTSTQIGRWTRPESMPRPRKLAATLERLGLNPVDYGLRPSSTIPPQPSRTASSGDEMLAALYEINAKLDRVLRALQHPPR